LCNPKMVQTVARGADIKGAPKVSSGTG